MTAAGQLFKEEMSYAERAVTHELLRRAAVFILDILDTPSKTVQSFDLERMILQPSSSLTAPSTQYTTGVSLD